MNDDEHFTLQGYSARQGCMPMIERLAVVVYWICSAIAAILIPIGLYVYLYERGERADFFWDFVAYGVSAILIWALGRGILFVVVGE